MNRSRSDALAFGREAVEALVAAMNAARGGVDNSPPSPKRRRRRRGTTATGAGSRRLVRRGKRTLETTSERLPGEADGSGQNTTEPNGNS